MSIYTTSLFEEFLKREAPRLWNMLDSERDKYIVSGESTNPLLNGRRYIWVEDATNV